MSTIYDTTIKNARMTAVRDALAGGSIELLTAADAVITSHTLSAGGGTVTNGVWTLAFAAATVAAGASGTVAKAQIKDSLGNARLTGLTVDTSGTDVIVQNTSINAGQDVSITSATVTHAPDPV